MASLLLPSRRLRPPLAAVRVNPASPFSAKLAGLLWCAPGQSVELVNGYKFTASYAKDTLTVAPNPYGAGRTSNGSQCVSGGRKGWPAWEVPGPLSFSCYWALSANPTSSNYMAGLAGGSGGYGLWNHYGTNRAGFVGPGAVEVAGDWAVGAPALASITYDLANARMYEAGAQIASGSATGSVTYNATYATVFCGPNGDLAAHFAGTLFWMAVWARARTDDEERELGRYPWAWAATDPRRLYFDAVAGSANDSEASASGTSAAAARAGSIAAASGTSTATCVSGSNAVAGGIGAAAGRSGAVGAAAGSSTVTAQAGSVALAAGACVATVRAGSVALAAGASSATAYSSAASIASAAGTSTATARSGSVGQSTGTSSAAGYSSAASIAAAAGASAGLAIAGFIAASTAASTAIAVSGAIAAAVGSSSAAATSGTVNSGAGSVAGAASGAAISGAVARAFGSATCVAISSMPSTLLFPARVCIAARQPANVAVNASILACSCTN